MQRPRIVLADDHTLLLEAFEKLLEPDCDVVGRAGDGRELLAMALELDPDIIVLDISMPRLNGLEAAQQIKELLPSVKLIFLEEEKKGDQGKILSIFARNSFLFIGLIKQSIAPPKKHFLKMFSLSLINKTINGIL